MMHPYKMNPLNTFPKFFLLGGQRELVKTIRFSHQLLLLYNTALSLGCWSFKFMFTVLRENSCTFAWWDLICQNFQNIFQQTSIEIIQSTLNFVSLARFVLLLSLPTPLSSFPLFSHSCFNCSYRFCTAWEMTSRLHNNAQPAQWSFMISTPAMQRGHS